jgi:hypothetical protein
VIVNFIVSIRSEFVPCLVARARDIPSKRDGIRGEFAIEFASGGFRLCSDLRASLIIFYIKLYIEFHI